MKCVRCEEEFIAKGVHIPQGADPEHMATQHRTDLCVEFLQKKVANLRESCETLKTIHREEVSELEDNVELLREQWDAERDRANKMALVAGKQSDKITEVEEREALLRKDALEFAEFMKKHFIMIQDFERAEGCENWAKHFTLEEGQTLKKGSVKVESDASRYKAALKEVWKLLSQKVGSHSNDPEAAVIREALKEG